MAYYDHVKEMRKNECSDKYEELKKFITSKNEQGELSEWSLASEHIVDKENELFEKTKKIEEYEKFFILLGGLLPRQLSIYDKIK